jgi:hypothetical protein
LCGEKTSVVDPGCLSRITDPSKTTKKEREKLIVLAFFVAINLKTFKLFYYLASTERNLSHSTKNLKKGGGKISCLSFFCSHKFEKIENYFII